MIRVGQLLPSAAGKIFTPILRLALAISSVTLILYISAYATGFLHAMHSPLAGAAETALTVLMLLWAYDTYVFLIERRADAELSRTGAAKELSQGLLLGAGLAAAVAAGLWAAGVYRVEGFAAWAGLLPALRVSLLLAVIEELYLRLILFRLLGEAAGLPAAAAGLALLYAGIRLGGPGGSTAGLLAALVPGCTFTAAYLRTRRLWLPCELHFAWLFTRAGLLGLPVPGLGVQGLLQAGLAGPDWLTGGKYGVEASWIALAACLATAALFLKKRYNLGDRKLLPD